jgi:branched-chain amino acid transport system ATP-binding protein
LANSALSLSAIDAYYGDSHVLQQVSFDLGAARLLGLLGRNGAGKSTCMNVTMGLLPPRHGKVTVFGEAVTGLPPEQIAAKGVALVPQGRRIFKSLTVRENLIVAARKPDPGSAHAPWTIDTVFGMFPRLKERNAQFAGHLSGGEQQMLAIGRALMAEAKLLMLDEPSLGLSPLFVQYIFGIIDRLHAEGLSILLIEQNLNLTLRHAQRCYVLERGKVAVEGASDVVKDDPRTRRAYLGL